MRGPKGWENINFFYHFFSVPTDANRLGRPEGYLIIRMDIHDWLYCRQPLRVDKLLASSTGMEHPVSISAPCAVRTQYSTIFIQKNEIEAMRTRLLLLFTSTCSAVFLLGCTQRLMDGSLGGWHHMLGYGYGGMFMWLIFLILAGVIVYLIFERRRRTGPTDGATGERPIDILKRRFAAGELTQEEYDRLKKEIES